MQEAGEKGFLQLQTSYRTLLTYSLYVWKHSPPSFANPSLTEPICVFKIMYPSNTAFVVQISIILSTVNSGRILKVKQWELRKERRQIGRWWWQWDKDSPQQALISKTKWDPEHQLYLCPFLLAAFFKDTRKVREQTQVTKGKEKKLQL